MIDGTPKPKDLETITIEKICEEIRELAKKLPKPINTKNKESIVQFGTDFHLLFQNIIEEKKNSASVFSEAFVKRLKKAEKKYGEKWEKFIEDNTNLINQIQEVLERWESLPEIGNRSLMLCRKGKVDLAEKIEIEINLESLRADKWNELNPLLEKANEAMIKCGINPEDFY